MGFAIHRCRSQIQIIIKVMLVWVSVFTLMHHLSIKPEGATRDLLFGLNCCGVLCSRTHGCKHNHRWHGICFKNKKRENSRQRRKSLTLKDIHNLFLQMWYALLPPELHYRSLWVSVTGQVWGKLHHSVPGKMRFYWAAVLWKLSSLRVRLIKSNQFGLEFLWQFFSDGKDAQAHL